jgi:hypothetical protein
VTRTSSSAIRAAEAAALAAATDPSPTIYPQDARVDNGHLVPLSNIYPNAPQDWMHDAVQRLIVERKLAPFYRGLDDWEPPDDDDDFDREALDGELDKVGDEQSKNWRTSTYSKQDRLDEAMMYKKASECPICFLYVLAPVRLLSSAGLTAPLHRPNQVLSPSHQYFPLLRPAHLHRVLRSDQAGRPHHDKPDCVCPCLDLPMCTYQADSPSPSCVLAQLLSQSEPAACPYCVETNFGVTYIPPAPARRTGLGAPKVSKHAARFLTLDEVGLKQLHARIL